MAFATAAGQGLEIERIAATRVGAPTLVFLHEGLGSVALWRDFPAQLAARTGAAALVYSRRGYGKSDRLAGPRKVDYMHDEALTVLPALLGELRIAAPILIGHSDGASIALIHAGSGRWPVRALVLEAAHVFVEDVTVASIEQAKIAYRTTDLDKRLARYHDDPDHAFWGWNDIWLDPAFRSWNIESYLPGVRCPVLAIQGADDEYGTLAQLDAIERGVSGTFERLVLARCKHSPHRDQEAATLEAIARFIDRIGG
ncbi:MAG TPA: alpha/beta hydrolase [Stellaceae bacterium]|nr:alpha/beta hydrolase [Stellaceae bacterium]